MYFLDKILLVIRQVLKKPSQNRLYGKWYVPSKQHKTQGFSSTFTVKH